MRCCVRFCAAGSRGTRIAACGGGEGVNVQCLLTGGRTDGQVAILTYLQAHAHPCVHTHAHAPSLADTHPLTNTRTRTLACKYTCACTHE